MCLSVKDGASEFNRLVELESFPSGAREFDRILK